MVAILVVSAIGVGAAAAGTPATEDDTDGPFVDLSGWLAPGEDSSITVETSTATDTVASVQSIIDDVLSNIFDTPDPWADFGDEGDPSDGPESDDGDADDADGEGEVPETDDDGSGVDDDDASEPVDDGDTADDAGDSEQEDDSDGTDDTEDEADPVDDSDETDDDTESDDSESDADDGDDSSESVDDDTDASAGDNGTDEVDEDESTGADGDDETEDATDEDTDDASAGDTEDGTLDRALVEQYVHEAVNEERTARGLEALAFDEDLQEIARSHSQDMAERDYFAHTDPEGNSFADRYEAHGYECRAYTDDGYYYTGGENIAYTYFDQPVRTSSGEVVEHTTERELAEGIVDQWMNSDGHRENILAEHWNNEGIGIYVTEDDRVYATQNFC